MSAPDPTAALAHNLAQNLRFVRERRGLTQQQLARLCGVPRSTVANLETGAANPTLSVLGRLAQALQLSLEELLTAPRAPCQLFPRGTLPVRERAGGLARVHKLLPHPIPGMEIDRVVLAPGGRLPGVPHRPGTHEYLCCEQGRLRLHVAGERFDLAAGDVAAFPGDQAHSYHNPGASPAIGFSVVVLAPLPPGSG
ncbi:MAG: XRE family transcriptional regulator [Planctomycetes bacterium]|nr:XRE family transcriptional regulator [Planctomycetota bacterium]